MAKYRVKPGYTHGARKQYQAGDTVELTEQEAAGFLDKLELVGSGTDETPPDSRQGEVVPGGLIVNPPAGVSVVEKQLEAETGKDFVQTGDEPPTLVETDTPRSKSKAK